MDVLKPEVYWVGNRCYRVNPCRNDHGSAFNSVSSSASYQHEEKDFPAAIPIARKPYVEADDFEDASNGIEEEIGVDGDTIEVVKEDSGFKSICNIPSSLFSHIIGTKGAVKKRIEIETQTRIFVPRQNEKGDIVIRGQNESDVRRAFKRLEQIALNARLKREVTHFVCFPMNEPSVIEKVKEFKEAVMSECGLHSRGLDHNIFQGPEKLHLTVCVMVLLDERERQRTSEILSSLQPTIKQLTEGKSIRIHLKGLEIMNDDPSQVDVLYAKCESSSGNSIEQQIADLIANEFAKKGLAKESRGEKVKLHCTIINTRYRNEVADNASSTQNPNTRRQGDTRGRNNGWNKESFDARAVLQKFGNFDFGTVEIKEIKIATRHTKASDGFYKCYASLSITSEN
ncbi:Activating signal cointegrator 1 complex subunit 1 [Orchesella cincta]|uniref:Activating signal cointegrator 1 complex subunit 1 n=1 Tax=Orchesella cincta TaxID=48709 RepID=A0A1D2NE08_ORCCI|nr:Activating signal cointegrator 1 complex subunit 1 [Orchesella cincta]